MSDSSQHQELIQWLKGEGYGEEEIEKILHQVRQYDDETIHDSIMDSIARGSIDLTKII
jgi:hypothetical protein